MIILDGMPGAGKTTLLRALTRTAAHQVTVFPEAQPQEHHDDSVAVRLLLQEAANRIHTAQRLSASHPGMLFASDRCHIGVLAYRYALAATVRGTDHAFRHALDSCQTMGLTAPLAGIHTIVLILDPQRSAVRRAAFAHDPKFSLWFDPAFLNAYHHFLTSLETWIAASPELITVEAHDGLNWQQLSDLLPPPVAERLSSFIPLSEEDGQ
jgi:thymidylate kinase